MKLTLDIPDDCIEPDPPAPGDFMRPVSPARAWYRVDGIRPVESRKHPNRWMLTVVRIEPPITPERFEIGEGSRIIPYTSGRRDD